MARARRGDAARTHGARDARGQLVLRASCYAAARLGAGELLARGRRARRARRDRAAAGLDFAQALHACLLLGAVAVPVDLRLAPGERARIADAAAVLVDEPLGQPLAERGVRQRGRGRPAAGGHDLDAAAVVIHTSGTTVSAAAGRADLRQPPVERARLGRRARPRSATSAGCARCRCRTSAASRSCCARRSTRRRAVVHERFETDRVLQRARASSGSRS